MDHHVVPSLRESDPTLTKKRRFPWEILLILILAMSTTVLGYEYGKLRRQLASPTSYETCIATPGSITQESYPATCVTKDGKRFTQPLTPEEKQKLIPPSPSTPSTSSPSSSLRLYSDRTVLPLSFFYPSSFNLVPLQRGASQQSNYVFIDTQVLAIPDVWDGALAPIEIRYFYPDAPDFKSYELHVAQFKDGFEPNSIKEEPLTHNDHTGVIISGVNKADHWLGGVKIVYAVINTPRGPVIFYYYGHADARTDQPTESEFKSLVESARLLPN